MRVRLWLIEHSLSPAEEQRVRELRAQGRDGNRGPDKITYRKKRVVKEVEEPNPETAIMRARLDCDWMCGLPEIKTRFTTVFAAAPAEDGEKCSQIENAWSAEEVELPLE
jgi:hypothetical protein